MYARPAAVPFWFLASAAASRLLGESVPGRPEAQHGASAPESIWALGFVAARPLPQGSVLAASRWLLGELPLRSVSALAGSTAHAAQKSDLALTNSRDHEGDPAGVGFPAFAPEWAWQRIAKAEKDGADFVQSVDYLLGWALVFLCAGSLVTLVSIPAGLVGQASFLEPGHWAKDREKHSPAVKSGRVSTNWGLFFAEDRELESPVRRTILLRPSGQSADSQKASVSGDLWAGDFVRQWSF